MKLHLYNVLGYNGSEPKLGNVAVTFSGNQNKCTSDAKQWMKDHPSTQVVMKWDKK
jgi:hypothetical protein